MNINKEFDLKEIILNIVTSSAPTSCKEIEELFLNLPPRNSLIRQTPTKEQILAFNLLNEKYNNATPEELRYIAEIHCYKYHRIRPGEGMRLSGEIAKKLYETYYELTKSLEVKYILDNFSNFYKLCYKDAVKRQRKDDLDRYKDKDYLSTSRDPDSSEWKK